MLGLCLAIQVLQARFDTGLEQVGSAAPGECAGRSGKQSAGVTGALRGKTGVMAEFSARARGRDGRLRQVAAWVGAAAVYGAAQGLSAWVARYARGRGTRP
jgi:hypothetical protein